MRHLRWCFSVERRRFSSEFYYSHRSYSIALNIRVWRTYRFCNVDADEDDRIDETLQVRQMKAELADCVYDTTMTVIVPYVKVRLSESAMLVDPRVMTK